MRPACILLIWVAASVMLHAQESSAIRAVKNRAERGTLSDLRERVRGDTGKWNDTATLQSVPPLARKPQGMPLDDWPDAMAGEKFATAAADDNWLLFRSRQLDDSDRVWIEKIERNGNAFTITMHEAVWQGNYFKTFTYYEVSAVNMGKLPPGDYTVKWIVVPLTFKQLEKPREAMQNYETNWPIDEKLGSAQPVELKAAFSVR